MDGQGCRTTAQSFREDFEQFLAHVVFEFGFRSGRGRPARRPKEFHLARLVNKRIFFTKLCFAFRLTFAFLVISFWSYGATLDGRGCRTMAQSFREGFESNSWHMLCLNFVFEPVVTGHREAQRCFILQSRSLERMFPCKIWFCFSVETC